MNLKDNLIKALRNNEAWVSLANAIQAVNEETLEPILNRLKARPRIFDMAPEDVKVLFDELGSFFSVGSAAVEDRPLLLQQRQDEVRLKNTVYPLQQTLDREFDNIKVLWKPLYAPINVEDYPYGTVLVTAESIDSFGLPADEWFLTSRGVVEISVSDVYRLYPGTDFEDGVLKIEQDIFRLISPLVPVRIVFDGHAYTLRIDLSGAFDEIISISSSADITQLVDSFPLIDVESAPVRVVDHVSSELVLMPTKAAGRFDRERIDAQRLGAPVVVQDTRMVSVTRTILN